MPNESPSERRTRQRLDDEQRIRDAAATFRTRIGQGRYTGLGPDASDDLYYFAALLDSLAREYADLPSATRSDTMHAAHRFAPDPRRRKPGPTPPLSAGDGH